MRGITRFHAAAMEPHPKPFQLYGAKWITYAAIRMPPAPPSARGVNGYLPTEDGALEMLAAYIKEHRSEGEEVAHLHPFTEAAARKLVSSVSPALHPRTFLQKAHFAVRAAVDAEAASIDVADIEALLKETGAGSTNPVDTGEPTNFDVY